MGLEVGGYHDRADWPKMGPSMLIAASLILAIRTAKWLAHLDESLASPDLDKEIHFSSQLAGRVLSALIARHESIFPRKKEPWYQVVEDEDVPK